MIDVPGAAPAFTLAAIPDRERLPMWGKATWTHHRELRSQFAISPNPTESMSSPLLNVWDAAATSPFTPAVAKDSQFTLGLVLLTIGT